MTNANETLLDTVARGLYESESPRDDFTPSWDDLYESDRQAYRNQATATIQAYLEAQAAMRKQQLIDHIAARIKSHPGNSWHITAYTLYADLFTHGWTYADWVSVETEGPFVFENSFPGGAGQYRIGIKDS